MEEIKNELEKWKVLSLIEEAEEKLKLLKNINQEEDNSSELAGFEINKLLREQTILEKQYKSLVSKRGSLKEINHKKSLQKVQLEIEDVARSLKESTKKLCRLFKENKNIKQDIEKAQNERVEALNTLNKFKICLEEKREEEIQENIIGDLKGHNLLAELQEKEKRLGIKLKSLKEELINDVKYLL